MHTWRTAMPRGMHLKSEGFASNLYDSAGSFTLETYCREQNIPYADVGLPVALATFSEYGLAFQRRFVPELDARDVTCVQRAGEGFTLVLDDGESVRARSVVVAAGINWFQYMPALLSVAPPEFVTHSAAHHDVERFQGKRVTVIGAGASAIDLAALLRAAGTEVQVVARTAALRFHEPPDEGPQSLLHRLRHPRTGLGNGIKPLLATRFPDLIHRLPAGARAELVRRTLGPAPPWFTKQQIEGKVPTHLGFTLEALDIHQGRARLHARDLGGVLRTFESDHIIAGTGYRTDLSRLPFLPESLRSAIATYDGSPVLSRTFESSVPGLFFVGLSAALSFGPLLRFAYGARFCTERLLGAVGAGSKISSALA